MTESIYYIPGHGGRLITGLIHNWLGREPGVGGLAKKDHAKMKACDDESLTTGFVVFDLQPKHCTRTRKTNRAKHLNKEIERRKPVAFLFRNSPRCLRLVCAPLPEQDEGWMTVKPIRPCNPDSLRLRNASELVRRIPRKTLSLSFCKVD